jgi:putative spermidine/putrescine transport system ATP-binding protein
VHAIEQQGSYVKVAIRRTDHEDFVVHLPDNDFFAQRVDPGDQVVARWSVAGVHLLDA